MNYSHCWVLFVPWFCVSKSDNSTQEPTIVTPKKDKQQGAPSKSNISQTKDKVVCKLSLSRQDSDAKDTDPQGSKKQKTLPDISSLVFDTDKDVADSWKLVKGLSRTPTRTCNQLLNDVFNAYPKSYVVYYFGTITSEVCPSKKPDIIVNIIKILRKNDFAQDGPTESKPALSKR